MGLDRLKKIATDIEEEILDIVGETQFDQVLAKKMTMRTQKLIAECTEYDRMVVYLAHSMGTLKNMMALKVLENKTNRRNDK